MTPKEKAIDLVNSYQKVNIEYTYVMDEGEWTEYVYSDMNMSINEAKQCALIAVRFAIEQIGTPCSDCQDEQTKKMNFLIEVEQEIEKL